MRTDSDCIFCKIVAGDIPCTPLLETDDALAFMDIGPVAEGHVLLIPREHFETLDEMPPDQAGRVLSCLPKLIGAVKTALGVDAVNVLQNNGRLAGQVVPHVHFHLIPRTADGKFQFNWPAGSYNEGVMEGLAEVIKNNL